MVFDAASLVGEAMTVERNVATVREALNSWKVDPDLAGIRDEEELAKLPAAEREAWRALWRGVDAVLARAWGSGAPAVESK
jgi:hypothetical protein